MDQTFFHTFPLLTTANLVLRQISMDDLEPLTEIAVHSSAGSSREAVIGLVEKLESDYADGQTLNWGIILENELIGTCGYYRGFDNDIGEIGFVMREKFREQGYMKEAVQRIIDFGFGKLGLKGVCAYTKDQNKGAVQLLERLNFVRTSEMDNEHRKYERAY